MDSAKFSLSPPQVKESLFQKLIIQSPMEMFSLKKRMSNEWDSKLYSKLMQLWSLWCVGFVFFMAAPCGLAYKMIVPQAGLKPGPLEMKAQSPNHWTSREFREM